MVTVIEWAIDTHTSGVARYAYISMQMLVQQQITFKNMWAEKLNCQCKLAVCDFSRMQTTMNRVSFIKSMRGF